MSQIELRSFLPADDLLFIRKIIIFDFFGQERRSDLFDTWLRQIRVGRQETKTKSSTGHRLIERETLSEECVTQLEVYR